VTRLATLALALAACGTPPPTWGADAGECMAYMPPPTTDLMTPTVSFKTDVMPVFTKNCSSSSCHGIADSPRGDLFLGAQLAKGSDASTVYASLVGKPSSQLAAMPYVTAGDPANSYLMHKLDADQCMFETACVGHDCQQSMPYATSALPVETRDVVRRWIAQGAAAQ
jgi:hypothetical protein